jgi:hypothetical protein
MKYRPEYGVAQFDVVIEHQEDTKAQESRLWQPSSTWVPMKAFALSHFTNTVALQVVFFNWRKDRNSLA